MVTRPAFLRRWRRKKALRESDMDVIDLSIGTPDLPPAERIMRALSEEALKPENDICTIKDLPRCLKMWRAGMNAVFR